MMEGAAGGGGWSWPGPDGGCCGGGDGAGSFAWLQAVIENPITAIAAIIPISLKVFFIKTLLLRLFTLPLADSHID